jgi:hypothetical protein
MEVEKAAKCEERYVTRLRMQASRVEELHEQHIMNTVHHRGVANMHAAYGANAGICVHVNVSICAISVPNKTPSSLKQSVKQLSKALVDIEHELQDLLGHMQIQITGK